MNAAEREKGTMISKTIRIASMIVPATCGLSYAAWAATCSNASLNGTHGFLHSGTDAAGQPTTTVTQITFDPTTATFTTVDTSSHDGVITPESSTGTYAVASNCTATNTFTIGGGISFVVTPTGFLAGGDRTKA